MGRPYSIDLRERVVGAVIKGGLSRHQAAAQDWRSRLHQLEQPRGPPDAPHNLRDIVKLCFSVVNKGRA
jgi:hypothetical protein